MDLTSPLPCFHHYRCCRLRIFITPPPPLPRLQQPRRFVPTMGNRLFGLRTCYLHHVLEGRCLWYPLLVLFQNCPPVLLPEKTPLCLGDLHINCPYGLNHLGFDLAMHPTWWYPSLWSCLHSRRLHCSLGLVVLYCCVLHPRCLQGRRLENHLTPQYVQYQEP